MGVWDQMAGFQIKDGDAIAQSILPLLPVREENTKNQKVKNEVVT